MIQGKKTSEKLEVNIVIKLQHRTSMQRPVCDKVAQTSWIVRRSEAEQKRAKNEYQSPDPDVK